MLVLGRRLLQISLSEENIAKVVMCFGIAGIDGDSYLVLSGGFVELPPPQENVSEVVVRLGVIGLSDADGLPQMCGALLERTLLCQEVA